jgi:hypothetical protein
MERQKAEGQTDVVQIFRKNTETDKRKTERQKDKLTNRQKDIGIKNNGI